jgi:hypothetical protein
MITYELDSTKDLFLREGTIATVLDPDQVAQDIKTKLQTFQGEYFLDVEFGVPYFQTIFQKPSDIGLFDTAIRAMIYSAPGVDDITAYQSSINSIERRYRVDFTVSLVDNTLIEISQDFTVTA